MGSFFLLDSAFVRPKSQYANHYRNGQIGFVLALFYHRQLPSFALTGHYAFAPRSTMPNQRGQIVRKPSPAGYCQTPTAELGKTERDPISTIGPSIQYVTESGDPVGKIKLLWALASWCARTGGRRPFAEGATIPGCSWLRTNWRAPTR